MDRRLTEVQEETLIAVADACDVGTCAGECERGWLMLDGRAMRSAGRALDTRGLVVVYNGTARGSLVAHVTAEGRTRARALLPEDW